ncbi:MAG: type II toxin-antitoxin system RelE/ParE family toxin [Candidatus Pacebacteria bacterium]|nr:type II toxin-antitoxin system RelE/ParE family toxin [Candidatus Paceibacterota bacterium]
MISSDNEEYKIKFYKKARTNESPVLEYIKKLEKKQRAKVLKYIEFLRMNQGILDEPYSKHIKEKIRELRIDFSSNRHRIFYFTFIGKNIIMLHAFLKKTSKTPLAEIKKAEENYQEILKNHKIYEKQKNAKRR